MNPSTRRLLALAGLSIASTLPTVALACASCGCSLSSDWESLGIDSDAPFRFDLRYDYLDQNQLRSGTRTITPAAASQLQNNGDPQEVEKYTRNQYTTLGLDYTIDDRFAVNAQLPFIQRSHSTLGTASDGTTAGAGGGQYDSRTSNIGDVKLIGRYRAFTDLPGLGVLLGVKLPSGRHDLTGHSTDPTNPDPVAIDRGLQPGTGTTDFIVGAYYSGAFAETVQYFAQGLFQRAADSKDQYRPGNGTNLTFGLRYTGFTSVTPQIQFNARHVNTDSGEQADRISTGGTLIYASPGAVIPVTTNTSVYGFVQVPVYQNLKGVQLAPRFTASIGARFAF